VSEQLHLEIAAGEGLYLTQAARRFPSYRNNRPVGLSCLVRWVLTGARTPDGGRVHLEAAWLAGKWVTTPGAIARFLAAQTPGDAPDNTPAPRPHRNRRKAAERANAALAARIGG
jgi:hypothetical protein